jgi:hypothetical protein
MPWDWNKISINRNITYDIVKNNLDKPWDWSCLSLHPNIFKFSEENIIREYIAARKIVRAFKEANSNPEYKLCRDRLLREFMCMREEMK